MKINREKYLTDTHNTHKRNATAGKIASAAVATMGTGLWAIAAHSYFSDTPDSNTALAGVTMGALFMMASRLFYEMSAQSSQEANKYKQMLREFQTRQKQR